MLFDVPSSLAGLLSLFGSCFTAPTFETFCALAVGLLTRVRERTVTGMLSAAGLAGEWHHCRAHRFFSRARWCPDRLGLMMLELVVSRLLDPGEPIVIAIDDTLMRRYGPKVFGCCRIYDGGSVSAGQITGVGNPWVVAGVVVRLSFLSRPVCLPVLFRLWRPGQGPTQVQLAGELIGVIAGRYPDRPLIVLGDGSYAARTLSPSQLPANVALVVRARRDIRLYEPPPARMPGTRGRRRLKGELQPSLPTLAADPDTRWQKVTTRRNGQAETAEVICQDGFWYRGWGLLPAKALCIRNPQTADQIEAVLITSDPQLDPARILELYAMRWSIEVTFRDAKQLVGVGEAQNRTPLAVQRTVPFAFLCLTLAIIWYTLAGHAPTDVADHRARQPWYRTKREPSVQDMLAKLRRTIIKTRITVATASDPNLPKLEQLTQAWELAAA
jgi:DDE superfamily endonuclease